MQISRHWRLNEQRYRLAGTRSSTGDVRFQPRMEFVEPVEVTDALAPEPVTAQPVLRTRTTVAAR